MRWIWIAIMLISMCLPMSAMAQRSRNNEKDKNPRYKLSNVQSLPAVGLKLRIWDDAKAIPLPPPAELAGTTDGVTPTTYIVMGEHLFYHQSLGRYEGPSGAIEIFQIKYPLPNTKPSYQFYNTKDELKAYLDKPDSFNGTNEEIIKWFKDFVDIKIDPEKIKKPTKKGVLEIFSDDEMLSVANGEGVRRYFWAVARVKNADPFVFVVIMTSPTPTTNKLKATMERDFKRAHTYLDFSPTAAIRESKVATAKPKSKKGKQRSELYLQKLAETEKMVRNMKGWNCIETDYYVIATNSKDKKMVREVTDELNQCHEIYESYFPNANDFEDVALVKLFGSREEYLAYVPPSHQWSGGLFMPATRELLVSGMMGEDEKKNSAQMKQVLYHEGFHHFLSQTSGGRMNAAPWLNEGCARFFENIVFKSKKAVVTITDENFDRWSKQVPQSPEKFVPRLNEILKMDQPTFYIQEKAMSNYDFAGALMYFILKSPAFMPKGKDYTSIALAYFDEIKKTNPNATEKAWEGVDKKQFAEEMIKFYKTRSLQTKAAKYLPPKVSRDDKDDDKNSRSREGV